MTESDARRVAEQAALAEFLKGSRVAVVGELGVASLLRTDAAADVERAQARADEVLEAARRQGRELVEAARERARSAGLAYDVAYRFALDAGWSAAELERMGYSPGPGLPPARRRSASAGAVEASPAPAPPAVEDPPVDAALGAADPAAADPAAGRASPGRRPAEARRSADAATAGPVPIRRRRATPVGAAESASVEADPAAGQVPSGRSRAVPRGSAAVPGRAAARRQAASNGPDVGEAGGAALRVSFSGMSGVRPAWRPISPRRTRTEERDDRPQESDAPDRS